MRYAMIATSLLVLALVGCGTREAAKASEQARQANAAVAKDLMAALQDAGLALEGWRSRAQVWLKLVTSAEASSAVATQALAPDEPPQVPTTEDMAIREPDRFVAMATRQVGRAEAEIEDNRRWRSAAQVLGTWAAALAGGDWTTWLLTLVGGGGGLAAVGVKVAQTIGRQRKALVEAVRTGDELANAEDDHAVAEVKKRAAVRQQRLGVKADIEKAIISTKGGGHAV